MTKLRAHQGAISVLSWNANKLKLRDSLISLYLNSHPKSTPEVIIVQEPGDSPPSLLKSSHAVISTRDLLVYHVPGMDAKIVLSTDDASVIQVGTSIFGCYLRNGSSPSGLHLLMSLLDQHRGSFLVMGDLGFRV